MGLGKTHGDGILHVGPGTPPPWEIGCCVEKHGTNWDPTQRTQKVPEEFIEKSSTLGSLLHSIEFPHVGSTKTPVLYDRLGVY